MKGAALPDPVTGPYVEDCPQTALCNNIIKIDTPKDYFSTTAAIMIPSAKTYTNHLFASVSNLFTVATLTP